MVFSNLVGEERFQLAADLLLNAKSEDDIEQILTTVYPLYPLRIISARLATILKVENWYVNSYFI